MKKGALMAGAAIADITPDRPIFLYGYPHVERISTGIHDPLYASAMVLDNGHTRLALCATDLIFVTKDMTRRIRKLVHAQTGISSENITITASHTHSGPITTPMLSNRQDPVVPPVDEEWLEILIGQIAGVIARAARKLDPCELAITTADGKGVGGNRRSRDNGAIDSEVPLILLRRKSNKQLMAVSSVYCMHPTVIHEDSKLYSGDFPAYVRMHLQKTLGSDVILLYNTGPEGNQSPRHFVSGNTFAEAERLGTLLGTRMGNAIRAVQDADFASEISLGIAGSELEFKLRKFQDPAAAEKREAAVLEKLNRMRREKADPKETRTVECDWFGAQESTILARAAANGDLDQVLENVLPAEVQVVDMNGRYFVFLPGEMFVEYSLAIKKAASHPAYAVALSNGELQGYIVTEEAYQEGGYEASNSLFPPECGEMLVREAVKLMDQLHGA